MHSQKKKNSENCKGKADRRSLIFLDFQQYWPTEENPHSKFEDDQIKGVSIRVYFSVTGRNALGERAEL